MASNDTRKKGDRRDDARAKALALREAQLKRERRNRIISITALATAVVVLVGAVWFIQRSGTAKQAALQVAYTGPALDIANVPGPSSADADAIPVGTELVAGKPAAGDKALVVDVYYDYMCTFCHQFDEANATDIDALLKGGNVTFAFHPVSFLDDASKGTQYSTRAANATAVVADKDPAHFLAFHNALYDNYPGENTTGLDDAKLASIAQGVGVPKTVTDQFTTTVSGSTERTYSRWIAAATAAANKRMPGFGTPTILINGVKWPADAKASDLYKAGPLAAAVLAEKVALGLK